MYGHLTESIRRAPSGPRIAALFDLDRTLLEGFSAFAFLQQRLLSGRMPRHELQANLAALAKYTLGRAGLTSVMENTTRALRGVDEASFSEVGRETFERYLRQRIYPEARALIAAHRARGHTLAIISAATRYQIEPVAEELGIGEVLCTGLEVDDAGLFTGRIVEPPCWQEGKAIAARRLAAQRGFPLSQAYFYTDAIEDLPLLNLVGHPHPLNPDRALARIAAQRDWPVHHFTKRHSGLNEAVRTLFAYGSALPAGVTGLALRRLTGSNQRATNVAAGLWADLAANTVGLDVRIRGREHLAAVRPAVFVFNHQSQVDAIVLARLLRDGVAPVAAARHRQAPLLGALLQGAGTVFIDGDDEDGLEPALETLRAGTSLLLAPEGRQSDDGQLQAFEPTAFAIAQRAGVPVIPVVLHNARDAQPKGELLLRPATIYVEVLPPVATDDWREGTLDAAIAGVRAQFLDALGQQDAVKPAPPRRRARGATKKPTRRKPRPTP